MGTPQFFRRSLAGLAGLTIAATAIELAMARHWQSLEQLIAWGTLLAAAAALLLVIWKPTTWRIRAARTLGLLVMTLALVGVWRHVVGNYESAELDAVYSVRWPLMSEAQRWWAAFIDSVGPAPTMAPLVLAEAALSTVLATVGWEHDAASVRSA